MSGFLIDNEPVIRLAAFLGIVLAMAAWEVLAPRRPRPRGRARRWPVNIGLVVVDTVLVRIVFPAAVVAGVAALAAERGWGLFNVVAVPGWLAFAVSVLALDFLIWAQHLAFHHVAPLWRLHRVHHCDLDVDFTTGVRFHPVEILLSVVIKFAAVVALGTPVTAVIAFEILLNATSVFNHGNVRLTGMPDRVVRALLVTPDMHRVHHSWTRHETDSNFGFCLSWWDRLFGTYRAQPEKGHDGMTLGLPVFRSERDQGFWRLLGNPLVKDAGKRLKTPPA